RSSARCASTPGTSPARRRRSASPVRRSIVAWRNSGSREARALLEEREAETPAAVGGGDAERAGAHRRVDFGERRRRRQRLLAAGAAVAGEARQVQEHGAAQRRHEAAVVREARGQRRRRRAVVRGEERLAGFVVHAKEDGDGGEVVERLVRAGGVPIDEEEALAVPHE